MNTRADYEAIEDELLRVYLDPDEITTYGSYAGYPRAWHVQNALLNYHTEPPFWTTLQAEKWEPGADAFVVVPIKDLIRIRAGHRCERCKHPFVVGSTPGQWSPCDEFCVHGGPIRTREIYRGDGTWSYHASTGGHPAGDLYDYDQQQRRVQRWEAEAEWRILTVHHLNGVKHDCRWWNLAALCQRCHLTIQAKVHLLRPYDREHSEWFKPHAAGFYADELLGLQLTRREVLARMDEILRTQQTQDALWETAT